MTQKNSSSFSIEKLSDNDALIHIETPWSDAQVRLYGGSVIQFQKKEEEPLLFFSQKHDPRGVIRHGGIPLCFPWFGEHPGERKVHGFARDVCWKLLSIDKQEDGALMLRLHLSGEDLVAHGWPPVEVTMAITIAQTLRLRWKVTNTTAEIFHYEACAHAYLRVGDLDQVIVKGLQGYSYLDKVDQFRQKEEESQNLKVREKTDRIYLNTSLAPVLELDDSCFKRTIYLSKKNSNATVLWNPWQEEILHLTDILPEEYRYFLCLEGAQMHPSVALFPGKEAEMEIALGTRVW